jgi:amino acid transporter
MKNSISLLTAVLINLNIIIGGAYFLSASQLAARSGVYAVLAWVFVGIALLPLVLVLAGLAKKYPVSGGLYIYTQKEISPLWGFISGWCYFIGTAAGNALVLYAIRVLMQNMGFTLFSLGDFALDSLLILVFSALCLFNVTFMDKLQHLFTGLKTVPFLATVVAFFYAFDSNNFINAQPLSFSSFTGSIPLIFFTYLGIEATCSIVHLIKDGEKNAPKALILSLGLVTGIYALTQILIVGIHGPHLADPFSSLMPKISSNPAVIAFGTRFIETSFLASFLGGFYSMFFTNNWNLHVMAQEKEIVFSKTLAKQNAYQSPWICIFIQAALVLGFLALTRSAENLMVMSDFGIVITYLLSIAAYLAAFRTKKHIIIGACAALSSLFLLVLCFNNLLESGYEHSLPFLALLLLGLCAYKLRPSPQK